jgi:D-aspartate ligase
MMQRLPVAIFDNFWSTTLAFARSLGRQSVPLHLYGNGAGRWSRYCTRRFRCPPAESTEFQPWLRDQISSGEIARIAPTTDLIAYHVSVLRSEFTPEVQRTIAPLVEIENCLIKTRFAVTSAIAGCATLPTLAPDSLESAIAAGSELGYPLVMKPKSHLAVGVDRGRLLVGEADLVAHFRQYCIAPDQEEIAVKYPELYWPLLQRYVPSARTRVYSVSGVKDADGGVLTACVSYKAEQWPPDVGVSTIQVAHNDQRILEFGLNVLNQTLSRGIFEVEVLVDGEALYAIDLNPRAFGFLELDLARGSDLPWLWYQSTMGAQAPAAPSVPDVPIQARHWLLHLLKSMARRLAPGAEQPESAMSQMISVSMLGHRSDPLPMIISNLQLLRHPRSLIRAQLASARAPHEDKV